MTTAVIPPGTGWAVGDSVRVLPGFVDEHLHIEAWLRSQLSVPLANGRLEWPALVAALRHGPPHGEWLVLFGLDHTQSLEECLAVAAAETQTPVLVMHRTGHAAVLNAPGSRWLGLGEASHVVYEPRGVWSRVLGGTPEPVRRQLLDRLRTALLAQGVVDVVDATPYRRKDEERVARLRAALWPVRVNVMGDPLDPVPGCTYLKVTDPRSLSALLERKPELRSERIAIHAVEPEEILMALHTARFEQLRVEHAALCPPAVAEELAAHGAIVCANPGFLLDRYPAFAALRASGEAEYLHPVAALLAAGCHVVFGSDAPVSQPGVMRAIEAVTSPRSSLAPGAGARIPLEAALKAACGSQASWPSTDTTKTFVVIHVPPGADAPYEVVSTVIDRQICWTRERGADQSPRRPR